MDDKCPKSRLGKHKYMVCGRAGPIVISIDCKYCGKVVTGCLNIMKAMFENRGRNCKVKVRKPLKPTLPTE